MDLERGFGLLVGFYCEKLILKKCYGYVNGLLKIMDKMDIRNWIWMDIWFIDIWFENADMG